MRLVAIVVGALALAVPARASEERPTPFELESELVCPVCNATLDSSDAPVARRMKAYIRARIAAGDPKSEIKAQLVDQFGPAVLAVPRARASTGSRGCSRSPGSRSRSARSPGAGAGCAGLRDHYVALQVAGGLVLVALGALLFAGEFRRLRVYLNRLFEALALSG